MPQVLMPALSPTMEKGKLAKWLKKEGDTVRSGDVLAEIETDKATMEIEAVDEGTLGKIMVAEGTDDVPVNTPIAVILGEGEKLGDLPVAAPAKGTSPAPSGHPPQRGGEMSAKIPLSSGEGPRSGERSLRKAHVSSLHPSLNALPNKRVSTLPCSVDQVRMAAL